MSNRDFHVEQTYDEIRQYVFDAAYTVLTWHGEMEPPLSKAELDYGELQANRIADAAVMHLDIAESDVVAP